MRSTKRWQRSSRYGCRVVLMCQLCRKLMVKVRAVTTDHGVEIRFIAVPDITEALVEWLGGRPLPECQEFIDYTSRLWPRAILLSGWSHAFGNVRKQACTKCTVWPAMLEGMRAESALFKNDSWREHLMRAAKLRYVDPKPLEHFGASFANLRYETISAVGMALVRVRPYAGRLVDMALFANLQDRAMIEEGVVRCKDAKFQKFVATAAREVWWTLRILPTLGHDL